MRIRASEIAERLASQAEQVAALLLPAGKRSGRFWQAGDSSGSEGESLKVYLSGPKAGRWQDYAIGEGGDLLDLWAATQGKSISEAMHDAADWLGIQPDPLREPRRTYSAPAPKLTDLKTEHLNWLGSRMLEQEYIDRFGVKSEVDWIAFPYHDPEGKVFAVKYRTRDKKMRSAADCRPGLYGWQAIPDKARSVALVEGELDAIALSHYGMPTLSVPNGGGGDGKQAHWISEEFDRLNRFDTIFLCLDMDEPGKSATAEIMDRLGSDRCRIVELPHKDANECLQHGVTKEQMREVFSKAKCIDPDELRRPSDYLKELIDEFHGAPDEERGFGPPFPEISSKLRFREGELIIVAGPNGSGKSQYSGHQTLEAIRAGYGACIASMEFKPRRYLARLFRQCGAIREPSEPYINHMARWLDDQLWVFDLTGTAKTERMLEVFRYARRRYGVRVFLIDNLAKCGFAEDDYNTQKQFVDRLGDFAKSNDAIVFLVHHMRKGGEGKDGIKGTSAITDMSDSVLTIWRNHEKEDELRTAEIEGREPDPEVAAKPDALITCVKQRNGEDEPKKAAWFHQDSFQYLSGPKAKAVPVLPGLQCEGRGMTEKTFWRTVRKNGKVGMIPADSRTEQVASEYRTGEVRGGEFRMPRNPRFHRLAHAIGGLASENIDDFEGMDAHQVLKRLQIESGVGCDEMAVRSGSQMFLHRIPRSLSFASMSQDEFKKVMAGLCQHLVDRYWPGTTVEEIQQMADEHIGRH